MTIDVSVFEEAMTEASFGRVWARLWFTNGHCTERKIVKHDLTATFMFVDKTETKYVEVIGGVLDGHQYRFEISGLPGDLVTVTIPQLHEME